MRFKIQSGVIIAGVLCLIVEAVSIAGDVPPKDATLQDLAERAVGRCVDYARTRHVPPISIAVVDESGSLVRFVRQEGASTLTADAAMLKARTAARVRMATATLATQDSATRDLYILLQIAHMPGGTPIHRAGHIMGAIGVSGAEPETDAACANYGAGQ